MAVWIDMFGSFVIGVLLLFNVVVLNTDMTTRAHQGLLTDMVQNNATAVVQFMASDLRKMGYGVSGTAILQAQSDGIQFLSDMEANGTVDTLFYYASNKALASDTPNPADRYLYRALNNTPPQGMRFGITDIQFRYYSTAGDSLAFPVVVDQIRKIQVVMVLESPIPYDATYAKTSVQFSIRPKNLGL